MKKLHKHYAPVFLFVLICFIGSSLYYFFCMRQPASIFQAKVIQEEPWMNVFIHGSFKVFLGFLSFSQVVNDNLKESPYKKITKKLRTDDFFFRGQAMLQQGLIRIIPSFDLASTGNKKLAAFPIIQAYRVIDELITHNNNHDLYYTFGWSGLISQQRRRKESIRLYNAIQEELKALKKQGIKPKIRFIVHSHAGNLSLNLAAINKIMASGIFLSTPTFSSNHDEQESIEKMLEEFKKLPARPDISHKKTQRRFDYVPDQAPLTIDELIMFGVPIQPETEPFFLSDTFKYIYHFYSDEDVAQQLDWVSTRNYISGQRISDAILQAATQQKKAPRIIQAKIMYDRPYKTEIRDKNGTPTTATILENIAQVASSFLSKVFQYRATKDPSHKDFWCFGWDDEASADPSSLSPLPTVIMTSLLVATLKALDPAYSDLDINITTTKTNVVVHVTTHNNDEVMQEKVLPIGIVEQIKEQVKPWQTDQASQAAEFEAIYRHVVS